VRVTVIATGFGPERYRRRRREREALPAQENGEARPPADDGAFELPDDILEVPSFLRDP